MDGIFLEWHSPAEDDIAYCDIYRSDDPLKDFETVARVYMPDTSFVDTGVSFHHRFFYYAVAVNEEGRQSVPSDTLFYTLLEKANLLAPKGTIDTVKPVFSWRDPNLAFTVILKVIQAATETPVWMAGVDNHGGDETMETVYNFDGSASIPELERNTAYLWRIDVVGNQTNSGSETPWTSFTIR